jgi:hypothetical protein
MRTGMEAGRALRYKLRMMGIHIEEPLYCYGENMSVICNTQKPEPTLKKKSNSICYHFCREVVAMGVLGNRSSSMNIQRKHNNIGTQSTY